MLNQEHWVLVTNRAVEAMKKNLKQASFVGQCMHDVPRRSCAFLGGATTKIYIVNVPAAAGKEDIKDYEDLDVTMWMPHWPFMWDHVAAFDAQFCQTYERSLPGTSITFQYVLFHYSQSTIRGIADADNNFVRTLLRQRGITRLLPWYGEILIAKYFFKLLPDEILGLVINDSSWSAWMALNYTNMRLRRLVQESVRRRIKHFVGLFFADALEIFFHLLGSNNALITGPLVRCIMSVDNPIYTQVYPIQLDIILPRRYAFGSFDSFVRSQGYHGENTGNVEMSLRKGLKRFHTYLSWNGVMKVCLLLATDDKTLPGLLSAPSSSQMFALSHTRLYCFYPQLFAKRQFLYIRNDVDDIIMPPYEEFNFGLWNRDGLVLSEPCGETCPVLWRRITAGGGVAIMRWGGFHGDKDYGKHVSPPDYFVQSEKSKFDHLLSKYNLGPVDNVLSLLRHSRGVVFGSMALGVIQDLLFEPHDLNLLVGRQGRRSIERYIQNHGYRLVQEQTGNMGSTVSCLTTYSHKVTHRQITLTVSRAHSTLAPLIQAPSTLQMNFVSWYGAVCLYPEQTLQNKGLVHFSENEDGLLLDRYEQRGYRITYQGNHLGHFCTAQPRSIQSPAVHVVPFLPLDETRTAIKSTDIMWRLNGKCCEDFARCAVFVDVRNYEVVEVHTPADENKETFTSLIRPFLPPNEFLAIMRSCDVVVVGSVALAMVRPIAFTPSNLDLQVPCDGRRDLHKNKSSLTPLFQSPSTLQMNFVAWYGAVCLYPELTLQCKGLVQFDEDEDGLFLHKYLERGYTFLPQQNAVGHFCASQPRSLRSPVTMIVGFYNPDQTRLAMRNLDVIWRLRGKCCDSQLRSGLFIDAYSHDVVEIHSSSDIGP
ncbi:hypothetical protein JR316_0010265 [Psilocybe cubensis]|uniref:Uncharacterized protein n=1 Tax=Psilocybe cubensis TaxID=181762 RepID=A0ACB8GR16_PSICU|nr:hypothetical protein JR316_0010265 [Psilocybe cubensis]KAH9478029.1 hypothetical protein JR316_0010265 [Psilocybe cubensis]